MKNVFVHMSNTRAFLAAIAAVEGRAAAEKIFVVVDGEPGYGKTSTAQWFAAEHRLPFVRAKKEWRANWMLQELLQTVSVTPDHGYAKTFQQIIETMGRRAAIARGDGRPFAVVIDEADHIVGSISLMETIRDAFELIEVPVVLVGMGRIGKGLTRFPQIASRVEARVQFGKMTPEDTQALVSGRCEVPVSAPLVGLLHRVADGYVREALSGLQAIESAGRRLGRPVEIADMAGRVLLVQRATGHPYVVRGDEVVS